MIRLLNIFQTVLIIGGLLMISYGRENNTPLLLNLGVYVLVVGLMMLGSVVLLTQRYVYRDRQISLSRVLTGGTAMAFGMMALLGGILAAVAGYFLSVGRQDELVAFLSDRPGVIMLGFGVVAILYGAAGVLGTRDTRESIGGFVLSLPGRILGVIVLLLGIAMTLTGVWAINDPVAFSALWTNIIGEVMPMP